MVSNIISRRVRLASKSMIFSVLAVLMSTLVSVTPFVSWRRKSTRPRNIDNSRCSEKRLFSSPKSVNLEEPDESESNFGRMAYWDESYRQEDQQEGTPSNGEGDNEDSNVFSWYCGWTDELGPFFEELVPDKESIVLVPGIGNKKIC